MNMPDTSSTGNRMPRLRKSMPNMTVAALCRKNSTPPVASNWLIGAAPSNGAITTRCNTTPSAPTPMMQITAAIRNGTWYTLNRKNMPYMPSMISSA